MTEHAPVWMSDDHCAYEETVRRFFAAELAPNAEKWRRARHVERDFWRKAGAAGVLGASAPIEYGGSGAPLSFDAVTMINQGRAGDTSWGFGIHNFVTHYILAYGSQEQKSRWVPKLVSGELVAALAMTEPGTGSDLQAVRTRAVRDGDAYIVNGSKTFITNGQTAELICVVVRTGAAGHGGLSLLMVEAESAKGFRRGRNLEKLGQKGQDTAELFFEDMRVDCANLLGEREGQGFYQLMGQLAWERLSVALIAIGACEYALQLTTEFVKERKAFGKRILDFQNTRFKLAEAKTKIAVTRAFVDACVARADRAGLDVESAAMAKWWSSEVQCDVMDECLQLHGGYGYMDEYPICRLFADARVQKIYGGTNEIMKELIARTL